MLWAVASISQYPKSCSAGCLGRCDCPECPWHRIDLKIELCFSGTISTVCRWEGDLQMLELDYGRGLENTGIAAQRPFSFDIITSPQQLYWEKPGVLRLKSQTCPFTCASRCLSSQETGAFSRGCSLEGEKVLLSPPHLPLFHRWECKDVTRRKYILALAHNSRSVTELSWKWNSSTHPNILRLFPLYIYFTHTCIYLESYSAVVKVAWLVNIYHSGFPLKIPFFNLNFVFDVGNVIYIHVWRISKFREFYKHWFSNSWNVGSCHLTPVSEAFAGFLTS